MYAVIDLGSNSFHLLIAERTDAGFRIVDRCSKKIQLADGLARNGVLNSPAIQRGLDCLQSFQGVLSRHPIRCLQVVATQALREAANAQQFLDQARGLGFHVEVITGAQEAELIFHGINAGQPPSSGNRLIIDIGGASTEIALGNGASVRFATSIPIGCVRWRDQFFSDGVFYGARGVSAKNAAIEALQPAIGPLRKFGWDECLASSGSAKMLANIGRENGWSQGEINGACIRGIEGCLKDVTDHSRIELAGLKPERRDLLAAGVSIMAGIMDALEIESVAYSRTALREGILEWMTGSQSGNKASVHSA
ncbi:Ppx/GppA phosphatase family protein [Gilvimarinus sp. F26214L]|uniref:Ppx/GppA phosphatase family protein n=1 Tax=Gilvimarinus sp. DZF01 TaxID=3461371 RepID=UPI0040456A1A